MNKMMSFINKGQGIATIKKKYLFEWKLFNHIVVTFILLVILEAVFLFYKNNIIFSREFLLDFYLTLSVVLVSGAVWHLKSYGKDLKSHHLGMMTGMTLGMQTGMMVGIILGATDGFFVGALITMIIAASIGAIGGSCSGIAGILEGLMAGSMGGIMGAMTGAMLLDDLLWFMPPFMILNFIIMFGLIYMVYKEVTEMKGVFHISPPRFSRFFLFNLLALTLLTLAVSLGQSLPHNHGNMIH
jgi:hypothetical protein